jgi:serine O-acetyltransferase
MSPRAELIASTTAFLNENAVAARLIGIEETTFDGVSDLIAALLFAVAGLDPTLTKQVYQTTPDLADINVYDITETARRNFESGGAAATLLFSRGVQAILAHRIAHALWQSGDHMLALAVKSRVGRAFATDIHPAAKIGAGLWLDHGLGFVVGETCVIGNDVSIWHNVTLGSTLNDSGAQRHPIVQDGVVIGAGAIILGNVTIGANANVAAGAIVVQNVPPSTLVVGAKSREIGPAQISFSPNKDPNQ